VTLATADSALATAAIALVTAPSALTTAETALATAQSALTTTRIALATAKSLWRHGRALFTLAYIPETTEFAAKEKAESL
jgi:hypothetical protein